MKHNLPSLEALKVFESAARHLSFSLAATELCLSKAAISYQIKKLESEVGCQLFKRDIRQVRLTDSGTQLYNTTRSVFSELHSTIKVITKEFNNHDVSIAVTTYVAARWLSARVSAFLQQYPDISIAFHHSVNTDEFDLRDVDIAIRWGRCGNALDSDTLFEMPMTLFPVCNLAMHEKLAADPRPLIDQGITLLCEDRKEDLWQLWSDGNQDLSNNPKRNISDANVRVQATIDGQGIMLADDMMRTELTSGSLIPVSSHGLSGFGYVIKSSARRNLNPQAIKLRDWLVNDST